MVYPIWGLSMDNQKLDSKITFLSFCNYHLCQTNFGNILFVILFCRILSTKLFYFMKCRWQNFKNNLLTTCSREFNCSHSLFSLKNNGQPVSQLCFPFHCFVRNLKQRFSEVHNFWNQSWTYCRVTECFQFVIE